MWYMPRVSEQHLAARRRQIVDAATRCFNRDGFHGTSIHDVIGEAGLSVGAFYRYFRSKDDLIRAIAQEKIDEIGGVVDAALAARPLPPLPTTLERVLAIVDRSMGPDGPLNIAIQVWGEAQRDADLAAMVAELYGRIRDKTTQLVQRAQEAGQLAESGDPQALGTVVFGLIQGYLMQRILIGDVDRKRYVAGIATLMGRA
jgi:AcrR family transcriptional regulator